MHKSQKLDDSQKSHEFLGFQFEIISRPHNKNSYIKFHANGTLIFIYPRAFPKKLENAKEYISLNQNLIKDRCQQVAIEQQERNKKMQQYISQYFYNYPNSLYIFGTSYPVKSLSIESLAQMLHTKSLQITNCVANAMNVAFNGLSISYTKGYLGQCNRKHIKIDYRNILCDESLLYYLIVHELSHIRHPNHSQAFWAEVEKYCKNYKIARNEIKVATANNTEILRFYHLLPNKLQ